MPSYLMITTCVNSVISLKRLGIVENEQMLLFFMHLLILIRALILNLIYLYFASVLIDRLDDWI